MRRQLNLHQTSNLELSDLKAQDMIMITLLQEELKFVKIFHILTCAFKFTLLTICRK
jgi:hypothetical protein